MSAEFQNRLYEIEVTPPAEVWSRLSALLDEINADNKIASKVENTSVNPPENVWENVQASFETTSNFTWKEKKPIIFLLKRLAVAAVVIGIITMGWLLIKKSQSSTEIASTPEVKENTFPKSEISTQKENTIDNDNPANTQTLSAINSNSPTLRAKQFSVSVKNKNQKIAGQPLAISLNNIAKIKEEISGKKIFDLPIDDLSMISANDNYFTMVNSNGRLVKIPAYLAPMAPRLQDKPVTEDYYEILYGEGAYWKDKLSEWRKKLADSPASAGDMFSNALELLKSVQNN